MFSFNAIQSNNPVDVHKGKPLHMDDTQKSRSVRNALVLVGSVVLGFVVQLA